MQFFSPRRSTQFSILRAVVLPEGWDGVYDEHGTNVILISMLMLFHVHNMVGSIADERHTLYVLLATLEREREFLGTLSNAGT